MPKLVKYVQIFRRRREGKTDYRKRRGLIIGRQPFLSIRVSGKYIYGQILRATAKGDITLCAASSRDLEEKFGWKGSAKNIPGAYLTGLYLGKLANQENIVSVVVYVGVGRFIHGSRIASLIAGAKESGLQIEIDEKSLPDEERLRGGHISNYAKTLQSKDKDLYARSFSGLTSSGFNPESYPAHFEKVKSAITEYAGNAKSKA